VRLAAVLVPSLLAASGAAAQTAPALVVDAVRGMVARP
jgi:hypothetical protein